MKTLWGREPAAVIAFTHAVLAFAVAFGLSLTDEQLGAVMAVTALGLGLVTRSQVTPAP